MLRHIVAVTFQFVSSKEPALFSGDTLISELRLSPQLLLVLYLVTVVDSGTWELKGSLTEEQP